MANYYYVKSGGTANGTDDARFTTKQTGTMASLADTYQTLAGAFGATTPPVSGDIICVSDGHSVEAIGSAIVRSITVAGNGFTHIVSVDDSNVENYKKATVAQFSVAASVEFAFTSIKGIYFTVTANLFAFTSHAPNSLVSFSESVFDLTTSTRTFYISDDSAGYILSNCDVNAVSGISSVGLFVGGSYFHVTGTRFTATAGTFDELTFQGFSGGGAQIRIYGSDLTDIPVLIGLAGSAASGDDTIDVKLYNCIVDANLSLAEETLSNPNHKIELYGCDDSTSDEPSTLKFEWFNGFLDSVIGTSSTANLVNSGSIMTEEAADTYLSFKITTNANTTIETPFYFDLPTQWSELSAATTDNIRIHLACADILTDADVWVEVLYSDGTTKVQYNRAVSVAQDPMRTGTTLTTDSTSTWSSGSVTNKYQIDVDTSGDVGSDCAPIVRVYINSDPASSTIYFDSEYELVA